MIKLSDIIKSGGGNAKINQFINKYVINKKEKKNIIKEIKECKGSSSGSYSKYITKYYRFKEGISDEVTQFAAYGSTIKIDRDGDISITFTIELTGADNTIKMLGFSFNPLYTEIVGTKMYIDSFEELVDNGGFSEMKQYVERITEEEYYKID